MKKNQILFLLAVLLVLVGLVFFKKSRVSPEVTREEFAEVAVDFKDGEHAGIIEILKGSDPQPGLRLVRSGENWTMPLRWNMPVQQKKINDAFAMLKGLKGELRGTDEKLFSDFEIEDDKAYRIKIKGADDKELLHLLIGTKSPRHGASFIRLAGSPNVFLVDFNLMVTFGINTGEVKSLSEKYWADMKVIDFDNADITGIRMDKRPENGPAKIIELNKTVDPATNRARWSFARQDLPFSVDAEKAASYLDIMKGLTGTDFHDPNSTEYGFDKFTLEVKLNADAEDKKQTLTVGGVSASDSESRYVRAVAGKPVFTLPKYSIQTIDVDESYFFPANPLGVDKDKLTAVVIHKPDGEKKIEGEGFDQNAAIINALKEFSASRLLSENESHKIKSGEKYWVEIVPKEGQPVQVDVGEVIGEKSEEYAAKLRNGTAAFAIPKNTYQKLFES